MPDDYYGGGADETPEVAPEETPEEQGANVALLPKEFFQGKELAVGSRCEVEIQKVEDDQVLVSYVPHSEDEESAELPRNSEVEAPAPAQEPMGMY